jgi:hypothetical protein
VLPVQPARPVERRQVDRTPRRRRAAHQSEDGSGRRLPSYPAARSTSNAACITRSSSSCGAESSCGNPRDLLRLFGLREPVNDRSVLVRQDHCRRVALPSLKIEIKARHPFGLLRIVRLQSERGNRRDATLDRGPIKHRATFASPAREQRRSYCSLPAPRHSAGAAHAISLNT